MTHGDDKGLRLPPRLAPIQLVVVPIARKPEQREAVMAAVARIREALPDEVRVHVDERDQRPGFKFTEWEIKGVPLRLEIGPRDVESGVAVLARRDTGEKQSVPIEGLAEAVPDLLEEVQAGLYTQASEHVRAHTSDVASYEELKARIEEGGFFRAYWDGDSADEEAIQRETSATIRCLPFSEAGAPAGRCLYTGRETSRIALFARAY